MIDHHKKSIQEAKQYAKKFNVVSLADRTENGEKEKEQEKETRNEQVRPVSRSCPMSMLSVPASNQSFGDRYSQSVLNLSVLPVCASQLWNELPQAIKASDNVDPFKKRLKTHLFIEAFG